MSPGPTLVHEGISRGSIDRTVRSGAPLSRKLSPQMKSILSSQDSLTSTGSNQELRMELESSLAEVKAAVEDVIVRKASPEGIDKPISEADTLLELACRTPGSREGVGRQLSSDSGFERRQKSPEVGVGSGGARPKAGPTPPAVTPRTGRLSSSSDPEGVLLKQNSWTSRKGPKEQENSDNNVSVFAKKKDMWEKRTSNSPSSADEGSERGSSFRGNRSFWEQKTSTSRNNTPGQTPDLVMDLPAGPLASSPPVPAPRPRRSKSRSPSSDSVSGRSTASSEDSPGGSSTQPGSLSSADNFAAVTDTLKKTPQSSGSLVAPSPKPRPQPLAIPSTPGSTVVPIRSPGPKTPKVMAKFGQGVGGVLGSPSPGMDTSTSSFASGNSSFKPSVRVKPVLQVKPEIKKDNSKDLK